MCFNCLNKLLTYIEEYDKEVSKDIAETTCECCSTYYSLLKHFNGGLKVICLSKLKRKSGVCPNAIRNLIHIEMTTKLKLQDDIAEIMDKLTEATQKPEETLCEGDYLNKAKDLKSIYDMIGKLDEAEDR
jgi:hypothetical protein